MMITIRKRVLHIVQTMILLVRLRCPLVMLARQRWFRTLLYTMQHGIGVGLHTEAVALLITALVFSLRVHAVG